MKNHEISTLCCRWKNIGFDLNILYFLQYQEEVTELRAIEEAFVPVIKFRYNGIEIDMTFAQTNMNTLPESKDDLTEALLHLSTMEAMEAKCIRSLNGYRSTMELLKIVSDKEVCGTIIFFGFHFVKFMGLSVLPT